MFGLELKSGFCQPVYGRGLQRRLGDAPEGVAGQLTEVQAVYDALTGDLPEDPEAWSDAQRATGLLAQMLEYYRREMNCAHWEFFRLHDLEHADLLEDATACGISLYDAVLDVAKGHQKICRRLVHGVKALSSGSPEEKQLGDQLGEWSLQHQEMYATLKAIVRDRLHLH